MKSNPWDRAMGFLWGIGAGLAIARGHFLGAATYVLVCALFGAIHFYGERAGEKP